MRKKRPIIFPIKEKGAANTLLFIHPGALKVKCYQKLAAPLKDWDSYAIDLQMIEPYFLAAFDPKIKLSVESLASSCVKALVETKPDGPYALAGWSFGGIIAFEAARQLSDLGKKPVFLGFFDSFAPVDRYKIKDKDYDKSLALDWFIMYLSAHRNAVIPISLKDLKGMSEQEQLSAILGHAKTVGALPEETQYPGIKKLLDTFVNGLERNNQIVLDYQPPAYSEQLTLFRAQRGLLNLFWDRSLGWRCLTQKKVKRIKIPGDHYSMLTEAHNASILAKALNDSLTLHPSGSSSWWSKVRNRF